MSNKKQTIAEFLNVKEFPFEIKDKKGNLTYFENSNGYWIKKEFDLNNNELYFEDSNGYWIKKEFDLNNNEIYYENSDGFWAKKEFDSNNNRTYYGNSDGLTIDNRPKELTMQEIADKFGIKVEDLKIKK